jgi:hypothetical protein
MNEIDPIINPLSHENPLQGGVARSDGVGRSSIALSNSECSDIAKFAPSISIEIDGANFILVRRLGDGWWVVGDLPTPSLRATPPWRGFL